MTFCAGYIIIKKLGGLVPYNKSNTGNKFTLDYSKLNERTIQVKKLILVTSPPACGKTFISKQLAKNLKHIVYLDKDALIVLSKQIFKVANEEYNRSSDFFEENIRNYEYYAIVDIALEALDYEDLVLINAPFTREIRDVSYMNGLRNKLAEKGAELAVIWVQTDPEVCRQRMIKRDSDRDTWKINNWDEYISRINFDIPTEIQASGREKELLIFKNSSEEEYNESMSRISKIFTDND